MTDCIRNICVTADDIAAGKRRDPLACPLAIAIRRETGMRIAVTGGDLIRFRPEIHARTIRRAARDEYAAEMLSNDDTWVWAALLPETAAAAVRAFDDTGECEPFAVRLAVAKTWEERHRALCRCDCHHAPDDRCNPFEANACYCLDVEGDGPSFGR